MDYFYSIVVIKEINKDLIENEHDLKKEEETIKSMCVYC